MAKKEKAPKEKKGLGTSAKIAIGCGGVILLGIIITIIIVVSGAAGVAKIIKDVDNQKTAAENIELEAFSNPLKIGETVTVNDVRWTVTKAQNLSPTLKSKYDSYGDGCIANSGTFVKVTVKVKNNTKEMVSVTNLNLYDSEKGNS